MFDSINEQHSKALDDILKARCTVRAFSPNSPSKAEIEAIIKAGLIAPFGALAVAGKSDFRKVIVIPNYSPISVTVANIMKTEQVNLQMSLNSKVFLFIRSALREAKQNALTVKEWKRLSKK